MSFMSELELLDGTKGTDCLPWMIIDYIPFLFFFLRWAGLVLCHCIPDRPGNIIVLVRTCQQKTPSITSTKTMIHNYGSIPLYIYIYIYD